MPTKALESAGERDSGPDPATLVVMPNARWRRVNTAAHNRTRADIARQISSSTSCAICAVSLGERGPLAKAIEWPRWDLAHDDERPGVFLGPTHPSCNRSRWAESPNANTSKSKAPIHTVRCGRRNVRRAE